jgi:hypothetical protein
MVSEPREYVSGPGFAWRVILAQTLRGLVIPWAIVIGLFAAVSVVLVLTGPTDFVRSIWWPFALFFAIYTLVITGSVFAAYLANRKHIPLGSRFTAQLGETSLAFTGPLGTADIAYSAYRRVERRHGFVVLRMRLSRQSTILPIELFPNGDLDRLVASVASAASAPTHDIDEAPLENWFVIDEAFVRHVGRAATRYGLTRPVTVVSLAVIALPGVLGLLLVTFSLLLQRDPLVGLPPLAFSVLIIAAIIGLSYLKIRRVQRRLYPVGSRLELGLTDNGIAMRNAMYRTEIPYARVRGLRHRGEFIVVRTRPGQVIIPSRLLPPEAEQRLLAALVP